MFYGWLLKATYRNRKIDVMQLHHAVISISVSAVAAAGMGNGRHTNHKPVICSRGSGEGERKTHQS